MMYGNTSAGVGVGGVLRSVYLVKYSKAHCSKGEYISIAAEQRPPDPRDWDAESEASVTEGEHDEANTIGENCKW